MFTGIIRKVGKVLGIKKSRGSLFLRVQKPSNWRLRQGDSVAVNGVCLTVKWVGKSGWTMELMPETLKRTTFNFSVPEYVNLERPLGVKDLFGGHIVLGHVDAVGKISQVKKSGNSKIYVFSFPPKYRKFLAVKGSVAIDGVSLTVAKVKKNKFTVSLVDYTLRNTTLGKKKTSDMVNIEFDILAKYVKIK